jgi:hypothetical protein
MSFGLMTSSRDIVVTLLKARDRVMRGWQQGKLGELSGGPVCLIGAVRYACANDANYFAALDFLYDAISIQDVIGWNDTPGRTQAEVVAALDRAVKLAEEAIAGCDIPAPIR